MAYYEKQLKAVIFDLDGVITDTAYYHYLAWKTLADELSIHFDEIINDKLKGLSRLDSLDIILQSCDRHFSNIEKEQLANKKNELYLQFISKLSHKDILIGIYPFIIELKKDGKKIAVGSSSKNAHTILNHLELNRLFDVVVSGNDITRSKPDPEVFLLCANRLNLNSKECLVIEDAKSGVKAAHLANMKSIGISSSTIKLATKTISSTAMLTIDLLKQL